MTVQLATICYIHHQDKILLLHRNKKQNDVHQGKWIGVGGKFERHETPEDCVIREVYEETGLTIQHLKLCGIITFPEFTPDGKDWYTYVFTADYASGELIDSNEGTLAWINKSEVLNQPTWEGDYIFLQWILAKKPFFSAQFKYKHQQLLDYQVRFY